jgi:hypothetical protein
MAIYANWATHRLPVRFTSLNNGFGVWHIQPWGRGDGVLKGQNKMHNNVKRNKNKWYRQPTKQPNHKPKMKKKIFGHKKERHRYKQTTEWTSKKQKDTNMTLHKRKRTYWYVYKNNACEQRLDNQKCIVTTMHIKTWHYKTSLKCPLQFTNSYQPLRNFNFWCCAPPSEERPKTNKLGQYFMSLTNNNTKELIWTHSEKKKEKKEKNLSPARF